MQEEEAPLLAQVKRPRPQSPDVPDSGQKGRRGNVDQKQKLETT